MTVSKTSTASLFSTLTYILVLLCSLSPLAHAQRLDSLIQLRELEVQAIRPRTNPLNASEELSAQQLQAAAQSSLARLLTELPGVSLLETGANISKPVVQGLYGRRLPIVASGILHRSQAWGHDHAPELDPSQAERIEVIKGAESVRFGSAAMGAVVLLHDAPLPYGQALRGSLGLAYSQNGRGAGVQARLGRSLGSRAAWRLSMSGQRSGDLSTASYLLSNTATAQWSYKAEAGYQTEGWRIEALLSGYAAQMGIFLGSHLGDINALHELLQTGKPVVYGLPFSYQIKAPRQDVWHGLYKLKIESKDSSPWRGRLQLAYQRDSRKEYDAGLGKDVLAYYPHLSSWTTDAQLSYQGEERPWRMSCGWNSLYETNENDPATETVPFLPNYRLLSAALYALLHYQSGRLSLEAGARLEGQQMKAAGLDWREEPYGGNYRFLLPAFSLSASWRAGTDLSLSLNAGSAAAAPDVSELFSRGVHHGAAAFFLGDKELQREHSYKLSASVLWAPASFRLRLNAFAQRIMGYIYDFPSGLKHHDFGGYFPLFHYEQTNAQMQGLDLSLSKRWGQHWKYELSGELICAKELREQRPLPYMPPPRLRQRLSYSWQAAGRQLIRELQLSVGRVDVAKQSRFDPQKDLSPDSPPAYALWEAAVDLKFAGGLSLTIEGENLSNELYRSYTNRFRYFAHERGRNVSVRLHYLF